jgi:hypothetical protein
MLTMWLLPFRKLLIGVLGIVGVAGIGGGLVLGRRNPASMGDARLPNEQAER